MIRSRRKLLDDVVRWREAGWVTTEGEAAIRAEVLERGSGLKLASVLSILGVVLIGFAAMSFVAANWQDMPRLMRFGLLVAGLWGAYCLAGGLLSRGLDLFAHAAILLGICLFGASIMLIAQMYHMDGHPPDAVLTWWLGALLAGVLLRSNPALGLTLLLVGLWSGWETAVSEKVHWPFLAGWGAATAAVIWRRWRPGYYLAAVIMSIWVIMLGYLLMDGHAHSLVLAVGLIACGVAIALMTFGPDLTTGLGLTEDVHYGADVALEAGMVVSFAALMALQFIENPGLNGLIVLAVLTLALLIVAVVWALRNKHSRVLWLGYAGFSIEILSLYFKTVGTLLGSSLFFFIAGLIVLALGWLAFRLHSGRDLLRGVGS